MVMPEVFRRQFELGLLTVVAPLMGGSCANAEERIPRKEGAGAGVHPALIRHRPTRPNSKTLFQGQRVDAVSKGADWTAKVPSPVREGVLNLQSLKRQALQFKAIW